MSSADDYPEHLNPFKRRGIRGSFRELKKNISRRFRRKDDDDHSIDRTHVKPSAGVPAHTLLNDGVQLRRRGDAPVIQVKPSSEVFPRSRFHERVNRAQTLAPNVNPFESEERNNNGLSSEQIDSAQNGDVQKPQPPDRKRYRRKKRAPLPPGMIGANGGLTVGDHRQSQWSISSYETDCSSSQAYYSEETDAEFNTSRSLQQLNENQEVELKDISKAILEYCNSIESSVAAAAAAAAAEDDVTTVAVDENNSTEATDDTKDEATDNTKDEATDNTEKVATDDTEKVATDDTSDVATDDTKDVATNDIEKEPTVATEDNTTNTTNVVVDEAKTNNTDEDVAEKPSTPTKNDAITNNNYIEDSDTKKTPHETDINNPSDDQKNESTKEEKYDENFNDKSISTDDETEVYNEHTSLYITGSSDDLLDDTVNFRTKTAIYVTGSCDQLNSDDPNLSCDSDKPVPKVRKHKPTRESLLNGSCDDK